jgi:CheY-like chemotaxis protein
VFLEYMMPVLDGAGVLGGMTKDAFLNGVPVVMMSSIPEAGVAERCRGYSSAFLRKPFRIAEVMSLADRLLAEPKLSSV